MLLAFSLTGVLSPASQNDNTHKKIEIYYVSFNANLHYELNANTFPGDMEPFCELASSDEVDQFLKLFIKSTAINCFDPGRVRLKFRVNNYIYLTDVSGNTIRSDMTFYRANPTSIEDFLEPKNPAWKLFPPPVSSKQ